MQLVALSIGGNDLGFSDIIKSCYLGWVRDVPCASDQDPKFRAALAATKPKVIAALESIRKTMSEVGYQAGDYRLVLQSYPSPLPVPSEYRDGNRLTLGCPFTFVDTSWVHNEVVPAIAAMLRSAAQGAHAEFLDLKDAFQGHEVCAKTAAQATASNTRRYPVPAETSEWARYTVVVTQGTKDESLHPSYYGQIAFGDCLGKFWRAQRGEYQCSNSANNSPTTMILKPLS